jgi:hypothetical protein
MSARTFHRPCGKGPFNRLWNARTKFPAYLPKGAKMRDVRPLPAVATTSRTSD